MNIDCSNYFAQPIAKLSSSKEHQMFGDLFSQLYAVNGTSAVQIATVLPSSASVAVHSVPSAASVKPSIKKNPKIRKMCFHGKQAHICGQCGGKNICEHGVQRNQCVPCGGRGICNHGRIRWQCHDCGGASMCIHGRRKARCIDCGGNAICIHQKVKYTCRVCKSISAAEKQAAAILAEGEQTPRLFAFVRAECPESVVQTNQ